MPSAAPSQMTVISYDTQTGYKVRKWLTKRETILLVVIVLFFLLSIGLLVGLLVQKYVVDEKKDDVCTSPDCVLGAASLLQSLDQSYSPCEDFYSFACKGFVEGTPVAHGTSGTEFLLVMGEDNSQNIKEFLERRNPGKPPTAVAKAVEIYRQCLHYDDSSELNVIDDTTTLLTQFAGWPITMKKGEWQPQKDEEFTAFLANVVRMGFNTELVNVMLMMDFANSSIIRITLDQPKSSARRLMKTAFKKRQEMEQPTHLTEDSKENYMTNVKSLAEFLGHVDNETITSDINDMFQLKEDLAAIATPSDHRMNYSANYETLSLWELHRTTNTQAIKFDWVGWLQRIFAGITPISEDTDALMVLDMEFMKKLPDVLHKYSQRTITNYVIYEGVLKGIMSVLKSQVKGISEEMRRSKCLDSIKKIMPFAITRLFVENQDFDVNKTREAAEDMVTGIQDAFKETLEANEWLDAKTKEAAALKVDKMVKYIGFPDWLFDDMKLNAHYDTVEIASTPLHTFLKAQNKELLKALMEYRSSVHERRWLIDPTVANAQYELLSNAVWVPIGILTPPLFDSDYLAAINYGGLGTIIGHEIGHGFDTEGSQFDEDGNLQKWWSDNSLREYGNRTKCYLSQYNQYCPTSFQKRNQSNSSTCLDGVKTLTENMADNIGLQASYKAYKKWVDIHGTEQKLPGLMKYSPDQLFFISFARMWCENYKDDDMKKIPAKDEHSPGQYRVIGPLSNFPEFAKTFGCSSGPMARPDGERCSLY